MKVQWLNAGTPAPLGGRIEFDGKTRDTLHVYLLILTQFLQPPCFNGLLLFLVL